MFEIKINKLKICFLFSFFALFAVLFYSDNYIEILTALTACILHETGHLTFMILFKNYPEKIVFYGGGIKIIPDNKMLSYKKDIIINLAGCLVNLIIGSILLLIDSFTLLGKLNIIIGVFNLLPFSSFDGGNVLKLIFLNKYHDKYMIIYKISAKLLCFLLLFSGIYCIEMFKINISLVVTIVYIILSEFFS